MAVQWKTLVETDRSYCCSKMPRMEWLRSSSSVSVRVLQPGLFKIQSVADSLSRMRRVHFQFCRLYFLTTYCQGRGSYTTPWDLRKRALIPFTETGVPRCPHSFLFWSHHPCDYILARESEIHMTGKRYTNHGNWARSSGLRHWRGSECTLKAHPVIMKHSLGHVGSSVMRQELLNILLPRYWVTYCCTPSAWNLSEPWLH